MGLSSEKHAELLAGLTPPTTNPQPAKEEHGHRRGDDVIDRGRTDALELRGVPLSGHGGVIRGTRPGDSAQALEQAGRDILRAHLNRNRYRPEKP